MTLYINPLPDTPIAGVRIEGVIPDLGKIVGTRDIPAASSGFTSAELAWNFSSDFELPSNTTKYYDAMTISWSISSDGTSCNANCASANDSSHKVYITSFLPTLSPVWQTALHLAVVGVTAHTLPEVFQQIWAKFAGRNVKTWYDQPLYYYRDISPAGPIGFDVCAKNPGMLLTNRYFSGQCGAFAQLFLYALAMNGMPVDIGDPFNPNPNALVYWINVSAADNSEMLIKDWRFSDLLSFPFQSPYLSDAWAMNLAAPQEMVPHPFPDPNAYGDLTNLPTIPGQNASPPSEKLFLRHFIVKMFDNILYPNVGPYFDPSYGVVYSDIADFQAKAVAGYAIQNPAFGDDGLNFLVWQPFSVNINLDR